MRTVTGQDSQRPTRARSNPDPLGLSAIEASLDIFESYQTAFDGFFDDGQKCLDLLAGVDDFDDDRKIGRLSQNLRRVQVAVRTVSLETADHGCTGQLLFVRLLDDPVVEWNSRVPVALADEDPQQTSLSKDGHIDLIGHS